MKKLLSLILALALGFGLTACAKTGNTPSTPTNTTTPAANAEAKTPKDFKKFKIGVCEPQAIDEVVIRRDYYENYLAPLYNVEFIFSEQCTSTDAEMSFIENCADAGADAIISYRSEDAPQMAEVCREYGMVYAINTDRVAVIDDVWTGGFENFCGSFAADQAQVGKLFYDWVEENASADGSEGFMITSSLSFSGNTQHSECTENILKALQDKYNLTYEDTIPNLAATSAPMEVANDKKINIYIYPGTVSTNENWLQGVSAALQTGKYHIFLQSGQTYSTTAVVVDEVEKTFGKDIKVASVASMSNALLNAFHTADKFGNASIDMATLKPTSLNSSMGFTMVYNALTGYEQLNKADNGEAITYLFDMWSTTRASDADAAAGWDIAGGKLWVADETVVNKTLGIFNPNLTTKDINSLYKSITFEETKARLG